MAGAGADEWKSKHVDARLDCLHALLVAERCVRSASYTLSQRVRKVKLIVCANNEPARARPPLHRILTLQVGGRLQLRVLAAVLRVVARELVLGQVRHDAGHVAVAEHVDGRADAVAVGAGAGRVGVGAAQVGARRCDARGEMRRSSLALV